MSNEAMWASVFVLSLIQFVCAALQIAANHQTRRDD